MKHTPGPWEVGPHHKTIRPEGFDRIGKANGGFVICELFGIDAVDNANLIAAAPELLEALERMVGVCAGYLENQLPSDADLYNPDYVSPLGQARDAINRAKGGRDEYL